MAKPALDKTELVFDDPADSKGKGCVSKEITIGSGCHDGASGGPTWKKLKDLRRGDLMALNGFGESDAWDHLTFEEMEAVKRALEMHNKTSYRGKYICCTCV